MNIGLGRVLIGIGVIVAVLALGALEVLTARLPMSGTVAEQANRDIWATEPSEGSLEMQPAGHDPDASVNERSEADRPLFAAQGG